jgi:hypothetical protein
MKGGSVSGESEVEGELRLAVGIGRVRGCVLMFCAVDFHL